MGKMSDITPTLFPRQLGEGEAGGDLGFSVIGPVVLACDKFDHGELRILHRDAADVFRALEDFFADGGHRAAPCAGLAQSVQSR